MLHDDHSPFIDINIKSQSKAPCYASNHQWLCVHIISWKSILDKSETESQTAPTNQSWSMNRARLYENNNNNKDDTTTTTTITTNTNTNTNNHNNNNNNNNNDIIMTIIYLSIHT